MEFTRTLSKGCTSGVDVFYIKQMLYDLGLLAGEIDYETKDVFDDDMEKAVVSFHDRNQIFDGGDTVCQIDSDIWTRMRFEHAKFMFAPAPKQKQEFIIPDGENTGNPFCFPPNIRPSKAERIAESLGDIPYARRKIVMESLRHAHDPDVSRYYPLSLYIPGATLYSKHDQTTLNIVTPELVSYIEERYRPTSEKAKIMRETIALYPNQISGADDCGGIVGLCHFANVCKQYTDVNVKTLASQRYSTEIKFDELMPGDWAFKNNHIGLYVGGGYSVEWISQRYGCQLTDISGPRYAYNFALNQKVELKPWLSYRRPVWY